MNTFNCESVARAALGEPLKREGTELVWRCPHPERHANGDAHPSMKINTKKHLWACFPCGQKGKAWALAAFLAGCDSGDKNAVKAWLKQHGLLDGAKRKARAEARGPCVAEYLYPDAATGDLVLLKRRYEPGKGGTKKSFAWFHRVADKWESGFGGHKPGLYRAQKITDEITVIGSESEKDADAGAKIGLPTFSWGGVENWRDELADPLRGKHVILAAHADEAGRKCVQRVAVSVHGKATSVKVCEFVGLKDLAEAIEKGVPVSALAALFEDTPEWKPAQGCEILDSALRFVRQFLSLTDSQAYVLALWTAHTRVLDATDFTPYLSITSAEKESGKTRVLEVLKFLVSEPWFTGRVSAAVLVRKIDAEQPTLLLDESDAAFGSEREYSEALRGILDTGYQRGGVSSCCVGQGANFSYKDFSTFCPKAIAGIGKLPDTVASRSIPLRLKRARRGTVPKLRQRDGERETAELRARLAAWCEANLDRLRSARPEIPEQLSDRQADCCEPLLAIADLAGGEWPEKARRALVELCGTAHEEDQSTGVRLLADIRAIFLERGVDRTSSADLVEALAEIETSPWSEWSKGKPITKARLAHLLSKFGITPSTVRFPDSKIAKGYYRADFADAWGLYLPQDTTPTLEGYASKRNSVTTRANTGENASSENGTPSSCNGSEDTQIASKDAPCNGVTVSRALPAHKGVEEVL